MKLLIIIGSLLFLHAQAGSKNEKGLFDVCYDDLGCFTTLYPFSGTVDRPIALLPQHPDRVSPRFCLYTRDNPKTHVFINHTELNPLFDVNKETKIIIHGFVDNGFNKHFIETKDNLLIAGDFNVVIVDWSRGNGLPYTQATANTQVVGAMTARLVKTYAKNYGLDVGRVHIIGHSLGAHTAGYAGERIPGLGRITGLDPAGPYFEFTDTRVRLDESDAQFVDIIHSDGAATLLLGLGLMQRSGHADFYVNGGKDQPNCPQTSGKLIQAIFNLATVNVDGLMETSACSHMAAVHFFRDSIINNDCRYAAYPCKSHSDFNRGSCISCGPNGCNQMGFHASKNNVLGSLYLNTQPADKYPYCEHFYEVTLQSNNLSGMNQARGWLKIVLNAEKGTSSAVQLANEDITFKSGATDKRFIVSTSNIGDNITSATVWYTMTNNLLISWMYQSQWSFKSITILYGATQKSVKLCPEKTYITSGSSVVFRLC